MKFPIRSRQRDPYWGFDGPAARGARRTRRFVALVVYVLSGMILALLLTRLTSIDPHPLLGGPSRPLVLGSLAADVVACVLVFAWARRRRALGMMGELPAG